MKAQELRIGNWIHLSSLTDGTEIDLKCELFHLRELGSVKYNYKPIPLTEEWLLKFGFNDGEIRPFLGEPEKYILLTTEKRGKFFVLLGYDDSSKRFVVNPIQYIHQLQNLYFALTGSELSIKQ